MVVPGHQDRQANKLTLEQQQRPVDKLYIQSRSPFPTLHHILSLNSVERTVGDARPHNVTPFGRISLPVIKLDFKLFFFQIIFCQNSLKDEILLNDR